MHDQRENTHSGSSNFLSATFTTNSNRREDAALGTKLASEVNAITTHFFRNTYLRSFIAPPQDEKRGEAHGTKHADINANATSRPPCSRTHECPYAYRQRADTTKTERTYLPIVSKVMVRDNTVIQPNTACKHTAQSTEHMTARTSERNASVHRSRKGGSQQQAFETNGV